MEGSARLDQAERLLDERGWRLGPAQVAAGRSGVVIGFPRDPMLHVSWLALAVLAGVAAVLRRRR